MDEPFEYADDLIAEAAGHGYTVTLSLLKRWYFRGLLPQFKNRRKRQKGEGKSRGGPTIHPAGSFPQLLRVLEIRAEPGRFDPDHALWRLWWEGWDTAPSHIRASLVAAIETQQQVQFEFAAEVETSEGASLESFSRERLPSTLARARKRTGTEGFETVANLALGMAGGRLTDRVTDSGDIPTLVKAVGAEQPVAALGTERAGFERNLETSLNRASTSAMPANIREAIAEAADADLEAARLEMRGILALMRRFMPLVSMELPRSTTARDVWDLSPKAATDLLPAALMRWLSLRRNPQWAALAQSAIDPDEVARQTAAITQIQRSAMTKSPSE